MLQQIKNERPGTHIRVGASIFLQMVLPVSPSRRALGRNEQGEVGIWTEHVHASPVHREDKNIAAANLETHCLRHEALFKGNRELFLEPSVHRKGQHRYCSIKKRRSYLSLTSASNLGLETIDRNDLRGFLVPCGRPF